LAPGIVIEPMNRLGLRDDQFRAITLRLFPSLRT
jgi:hypothetical protein